MQKILYWLLIMLTAGVCYGQEIIPNDGIDDTVAVQAFINNLKDPNNTNDRKRLPTGTITISDSLIINRSMAMWLAGSGGVNRSQNTGWNPYRTATILDWQGPEDKPIMLLNGCSGIIIEKINFQGKASHGIIVRHGVGSLSMAFRDLSFYGMEVGIEMAGRGTTADVTYDTCVFYLCEAGLKLSDIQSCDHTLIRPQFLYCGVNIDTPLGGDGTVIGGGSYSCDAMLRVGKRAKNTRGFDILSHRFDGRGVSEQRTQWVVFEDPKETQSHGMITFRNCLQIHNQMQGNGPLLEVAPGSRVVLEDCNLVQGGDLIDGKLAHVYSSDRATGELHVIRCDGIDATRLLDYIQLNGPQARYRFQDCGSLYQLSQSLSNMDDDASTPTPPQFTPEEAEILRNLLTNKDLLYEAVATAEKVRNGELKTRGQLEILLEEDN